MKISRPKVSEYPDFFGNYIKQVEGDDLFVILEKERDTFITFIRSLSKDKHSFKYAPDKWTIKEVIGHIIDAERVFQYRALRFARKDNTLLRGFEENLYVQNAHSDNRSMDSLLEEFDIVRRSSITLLRSLPMEMFDNIGNASTVDISVRALGYTIAGHQVHHLGVIKERYL